MSSSAARWFDQPFALCEDNLSATPRLILLYDLQAHPVASLRAELEPCFAAIEAAQAAGHWISLAASYELGSALEATLPPPPDAPLLDAMVFARARILEGAAVAEFWQAALASLSEAEREAAIMSLVPHWSEAEHGAACRRILADIGEGRCYQVNLTFPSHGLAAGHPLALFARLRLSQPVAHGVLRFDGARWALSRSPELFFSHDGERLACRPMKGTRARSADPAIDAAQAAELRHSPKEMAENLMIVDLIRNDLGRLVPPGGVQVERLFEVEAYRSVWQMTSSISAAPAPRALRPCLEALFPCGSVTGAPKLAAMHIIKALEAGPRGLYCGALGWMAPDGAMSFNVPIRTLLLEADGHFSLSVGSGIVADSEPQAEYAECLSKLAFARPEPEMALIETLLLTAEGSLPLREYHCARLTRSAQELGFALDAAQLHATLNALAQPAEGPRRVRLLLARDGGLSVQTQALAALQGETLVAFAPDTLRATDPRLRYKTTLRSTYDAALTAAQAQGLFDLVFCNEYGEVCEGARSNLFIETAQGEFLTPALACGLLPGVLRASLLQEGRLREARLTQADIRAARRIWVGNALRGLLPARLVSRRDLAG